MDVVYEVIKQVKEEVSGAEHHVGSTIEGYTAPAFLYAITYDGSSQVTITTRRVIMEMQMIFLGKADAKGNVDYEEKMQMSEKLKNFLNRFQIPVGNRALKFEYDIKNTDAGLSTMISFDFLDEVVSVEDETIETTEHVEYRQSEIVGK